MEHIKTSQLGCYLLSELVTMPDRELAKKIDRALWKDSAEVNGEVVNKIITALAKWGFGSEFEVCARRIVSETTR